MAAQKFVVNRWKSFLHKKFAGKTERMLKTVFLAFVLCSLALLVSMASRAATASKTVTRTTRTTVVAPTPTPVPEPPAQPEPVAVRNDGFWKGVGLGFVTGYIDYKEPGLMREYGMMYGVNASYSALNQMSTVEYDFEGELVFGGIIYDGALFDIKTNTRTPNKASTNDYIFNGRGTIGLYNEVNPSFAWVPYVGLGYRDLNDKVDGTGSYNRNISYLYLPVGLRFEGWLGAKDSVSFSADVEPAIGTVVSKLSDLDSSNPDITNHNSGVGFRLLGYYGHNFGRWTGHLQPFYQKWKMNKSNDVILQCVNQQGQTVQCSLSEPENESDFVGLNIGADF